MNKPDPENRNTSAKDPHQSGLKRFVKEPLLHFLVLAAALFLLQSLIGGEERQVIVVDAEAQRYLIKQEEDLRLRPLSEDEKQTLIDTYIEEEILVREAKARGLTDSSRIRALLLQNMRFFLSSDIPEPSEADLREYFETNIAQFTSPPSVNLNHVKFNDPEQVPQDILNVLNEAEDPSEVGDFDTQLGYKLSFLDQRRLVGLFGVETAKMLLEVQEGDKNWRGPIVAPDGAVHFLRVEKHNPPRSPDFDQAKDWVATHWLSARARELMDAAVSEMRGNYLIDVQPLESGSDG